MTITIRIEAAATDTQVAAIKALVDETVSRDVSWNGATPEIETGADFTEIDGADEIAGAQLHAKIQRILSE